MDYEMYENLGKSPTPDWCDQKRCYVNFKCKDTDKYVCNKDQRFLNVRLKQIMGDEYERRY